MEERINKEFSKFRVYFCTTYLLSLIGCITIWASVPNTTIRIITTTLAIVCALYAQLGCIVSLFSKIGEIDKEYRAIRD